MSAKKSAVKNPKAPKPEEPQPQKTAPTELQPEEPQPQKTAPTELQPEAEVPELQPEAEVPQPEPEIPPEPVTSMTEPKPATTPVPVSILTLKYLNQELQLLKQVVEEHASLIIQLQEILARKRKPVVSNGKIQIRDKQTSTVYPSKNNAYQTLLKSGELKELVDKGLFGDVPEKNTFGWYVLVREWPDRFEEVPTEEKQA